MSSSDQNIKPSRYQIIPRVLIFAFRPDAVLLIKLLPREGKMSAWTGRYNGPGGHIERGEDALSAARRELLEETGLTADLALCGMVIVDTNQPVGIGLFIFRADNSSGIITSSPEGLPEWIPFERLKEYPLVEDVAILLERIRRMQPGDPPFSARSYYDANDRLTVEFA
jgi:8-oxo-dGTP diphosphatase